MTLEITSTTITQQDFRRVAGRSSSRKPILIIGPGASTSTLAVNTAKRCTTTSQVVEYCAHGPLVEAACDSITHENRVAIIMRTAATGTAAAYTSVTGTFEDADAPTVAGDSTVLPEDDLEPGIEIIAGGTLNVDTDSGITYKYRTGGSLSSSLSGVQSLGTATSITLPYGGGKYVFSPAEAALAAYVDDLRLMTIDHFAETSGSIHGAADATSGSGIPGTTVSTYALAKTAMIALVAAAKLHVVNLASSIHGATDTTAQTALNAISISSGSTNQQVLTAALAYADAMFGDGATTNDAHNLRTASSIHGSEDTTNVLTADVPTRGVLTAGDTITAITSAPRWSIAELGAALDVVKLLPSSLDYDGILLCGPVANKTEADSIAAKVEALRTNARWRRLAPHFRARNSGESLSTYAAAYETAFGTTTQRSLHGPAVSWYVQSSHPSRFGQVDVRPFSFVYMARLCTLRPDINPTDETAPPNGFGSFTRGYVRDPDSPADILPRAVDDGHTELFTPLRAVAPRTKFQVSESVVFVGQGGMLAPDGSDFYIAPYARIIDEACNLAFRPLETRLGRKVLEAADHTIDPDERKRIEAGITQELDGPLVKTGIAQAVTVLLDPDALLNTPPPVTVGATIQVDVGGYIDAWTVDISLQ
jgi:hypothetical protein